MAMCVGYGCRGVSGSAPGTTGCQRRLWQSVVGRQSGIRNRESGFRELGGEPGCERVIRFATRRGFGRFSPHPSPLPGSSARWLLACTSSRGGDDEPRPSPRRGEGMEAPELAFVARKSRSSHDVLFRRTRVGKCGKTQVLDAVEDGGYGFCSSHERSIRRTTILSWQLGVTLFPCDETGSGVRGQGSGVRDQRSEVRDQRSEVSRRWNALS